jgi:hypothetical protein
MDADSRFKRPFEYLGFAELMAILMVLATTFSAVATWRTASIATALYNASERPYVGVEKVLLERPQPGGCHIVVRYRNFGNVSAEDAIVTERLFLDGKPVGDPFTLAAGILSPAASHQIFVHVPSDRIDAIQSGQTRLDIVVATSYGAPLRSTLCYAERFAYLPETKTFEVDGGSPRCSEMAYWSNGGPRR